MSISPEILIKWKRGIGSQRKEGYIQSLHRENAAADVTVEAFLMLNLMGKGFQFTANT